MTARYMICIEKSRTGYSAYSPDILGCIAADSTFERTEERMRSALAFHVDGMIEDGEPIPPPTASAEEVLAEYPETAIRYVDLRISSAA